MRQHNSSSQDYSLLCESVSRHELYVDLDMCGSIYLVARRKRQHNFIYGKSYTAYVVLIPDPTHIHNIHL